MPFSHYENHSEDHITLYTNEFNKNYIPGKPLRFIYLQPCVYWNDYKVLNITAYDHLSCHEITSNNDLDKSIRDSIDDKSKEIYPNHEAGSTRHATVFTGYRDMIDHDIRLLQSAKLITTSEFERSISESETKKRSNNTKKKEKAKKTHVVATNETNVKDEVEAVVK